MRIAYLLPGAYFVLGGILLEAVVEGEPPHPFSAVSRILFWYLQAECTELDQRSARNTSNKYEAGMNSN